MYHRRRRGDMFAGVIQGKVDETQLKAMLEQINEKTEQKVKVRSANASTFRFVHIYCPGYCCAPHELGRFRRRLIWRVELKAGGEQAAQQASLGTASLGDTCMLFPLPCGGSLAFSNRLLPRPVSIHERLTVLTVKRRNCSCTRQAKAARGCSLRVHVNECRSALHQTPDTVLQRATHSVDWR